MPMCRPVVLTATVSVSLHRNGSCVVVFPGPSCRRSSRCPSFKSLHSPFIQCSSCLPCAGPSCAPRTKLQEEQQVCEAKEKALQTAEERAAETRARQQQLNSVLQVGGTCVRWRGCVGPVFAGLRMRDGYSPVGKGAGAWAVCMGAGCAVAAVGGCDGRPARWCLSTCEY